MARTAGVVLEAEVAGSATAVPRWARLARRAPGVLAVGWLLVAAGCNLWAFSWPAFSFGWQARANVLLIVFALALPVYLVTTVVAHRRYPARRSGRQWLGFGLRWAVLPAVGGLWVAVHVFWPPVQVRFGLAREAFDAYVRGVEGQPAEAGVAAPLELGSYRIRHVAATERGLLFVLADDDHPPRVSAFLYAPENAPPARWESGWGPAESEPLGGEWYAISLFLTDAFPWYRGRVAEPPAF